MTGDVCPCWLAPRGGRSYREITPVSGGALSGVILIFVDVSNFSEIGQFAAEL